MSAILEGKECPYCGRPSQYHHSSKLIYGKNYGPVWACLACRAWVGCHKNNPRRALGRLADAALRKWKSRAHVMFDPLWKKTDMTRTEAYAWLAEEMNLAPELCHFGMFDEEQCKTACKIIGFRILQEDAEVLYTTNVLDDPAYTELYPF